MRVFNYYDYNPGAFLAKITSETASYCSLMIPPPQVDNINSVKICKCSVNRKLSSDESENASHGIADLYKS